MEGKGKGLEEKKPWLEIAIAVSIAAIVLLFSGQIEEFGDWGYLGAFIISLMGSATILIPVPSWAVVVGLGKVLDPLLLGIVAGTGSAIGELTAYLFGNGVAAITIRKRKDFQKYQEWIKKNDLWAIFLLSFLPNPLFDLAGLAAGAAKVHWLRFVVVCAVGRILRFILFGYAGFLIFNGA